MAIDWPHLLRTTGYQPPPPPELVAGELVGAVAGAHRNPSGWDDVRRRLRELGLLLGQPEIDERPWWRRLRDAVGSGVSAIRRIGIAKLLEESLTAGIGAVVGAGVLTLFGGPALGLATGGAILGSALIAKLYECTYNDIRRSLTAGHGADESHHLRQLYLDGNIFRFGRYGEMHSGLAHAATLLHYQEDVDFAHTLFDEVEDWVAGLGIELANIWNLALAHTGADAIDRTSAMATRLSDLRQQVAIIRNAIDHGTPVSIAHQDAAVQALDRCTQAAIELATLLFDTKALGKGLH